MLTSNLISCKSFQAEVQIKSETLKNAFILFMKFVENVIISASYFAPTKHIIVFIIFKYLQRVQYDEKEYNLCW